MLLPTCESVLHQNPNSMLQIANLFILNQSTTTAFTPPSKSRHVYKFHFKLMDKLD